MRRPLARPRSGRAQAGGRGGGREGETLGLEGSRGGKGGLAAFDAPEPEPESAHPRRKQGGWEGVGGGGSRLVARHAHAHALRAASVELPQHSSHASNTHATLTHPNPTREWSVRSHHTSKRKSKSNERNIMSVV